MTYSKRLAMRRRRAGALDYFTIAERCATVRKYLAKILAVPASQGVPT